MNTELVDSLLQAILSLPKEEKDLLIQRLSALQSARLNQTQLADLRQESFVGMWQDREEIADSIVWVCTLRQQHWVNSNAATGSH